MRKGPASKKHIEDLLCNKRAANPDAQKVPEDASMSVDEGAQDLS